MYSIAYAFYSRTTTPSSRNIDVPHTVRLYDTGVVDHAVLILYSRSPQQRGFGSMHLEQKLFQHPLLTNSIDVYGIGTERDLFIDALTNCYRYPVAGSNALLSLRTHWHIPSPQIGSGRAATPLQISYLNSRTCEIQWLMGAWQTLSWGESSSLLGRDIVGIQLSWLYCKALPWKSGDVCSLLRISEVLGVTIFVNLWTYMGLLPAKFLTSRNSFNSMLRTISLLYSMTLSRKFFIAADRLFVRGERNL